MLSVFVRKGEGIQVYKQIHSNGKIKQKLSKSHYLKARKRMTTGWRKREDRETIFLCSYIFYNFDFQPHKYFTVVKNKIIFRKGNAHQSKTKTKPTVYRVAFIIT